ncbi:hypothetical protein ES319_D05G153000v1 [Gossypium barbadense]|uniref:Uncharacterized protein n=2 Tax=Gossypium TaxID=3633 RepID=A0A5J5RDY9_GOSBA|nr:hypothetical protein ES319_D05G153000v1 [Gossypium barbadense]TYG68536.1 hypothetical protein ES288_D05G160800v1 [Gossypium darwinii]
MDKPQILTIFRSTIIKCIYHPMQGEGSHSLAAAFSSIFSFLHPKKFATNISIYMLQIGKVKGTACQMT